MNKILNITSMHKSNQAREVGILTGKTKLSKSSNLISFCGSKEQTLNTIECKMRGMPLEICFVVDTNGNIIHKALGDAHSISISDNDVKVMKGNIFTHNHPNNSTLSPFDIVFAARNGLQEIRAVASGGVYCVKLNDNTGEENFKSKILPVLRETTNEEFKGTRFENKNFNEIFQNLSKDDARELNIKLDNIWKKASPLLGWKYEFIEKENSNKFDKFI